MNTEYKYFSRYLDNTKYPFNQLPVLEVDGTLLTHSMSIMRYLGKEHGKSFLFIILFYDIRVLFSALSHFQTNLLRMLTSLLLWKSNVSNIFWFHLHAGYAPSDHLQQAQADAIVDQCQDLIDQFIWLYFAEADPDRKVDNNAQSFIVILVWTKLDRIVVITDNAFFYKEKQKTNWFENKLPATLQNFEAILKRNGSRYFVGDKV